MVADLPLPVFTAPLSEILMVNAPKCEPLWPSNMSTDGKGPGQAAPHLRYRRGMLEIHLSIWADSALVHERRLNARL